jgi:hypothetical protein
MSADRGYVRALRMLMRQDRTVRAALKSLHLEPDPATMPAEPAAFSTLARLTVGPADAPGEESFDVTVCTPEWVAEACRKVGGIYDARHHLVVNLDDFDQRALHAWLAARVQEVDADSWEQVAERLSRLGYWEFEDYRP